MNFKTFLLFPLILCGCTRIVHLSNTADFTQEFYMPQYATGFALRSLPGDTTSLMLEVYRPDTAQIIIPKGGFNQIAVMSSTYVGLLDAAGQANKVVAVSGRDNIVNPDVKKRAAEIGFEGAMDYETLLSVKPDLMLIYGIGGKSPLASKLDELSIPYVYVSDFEEQDPLGRAEWMVALGALSGADARNTFKSIVNNYSPVKGKTKVMLNAPYGGDWFIPGKDNYMSRLLADGGAVLAVPQNEGAASKPIDMEMALPALTESQIWLNPGQANNPADLKQLVPKANFGKHVWNQNHDFYESGTARPDLVLLELQAIVRGCDADTLHYFRKIQ